MDFRRMSLAVMAGSPCSMSSPASCTRAACVLYDFLDAGFSAPSTFGGVIPTDYQVPFRFTGKIVKLTVKLGPKEISAAEQAKIEKDKLDRQ
jgi:hypothetical protein